MKILRYMAVAAVVVGLVGLPQRPHLAGANGVAGWRAVCHAGKYSLVLPAGWGFLGFGSSGNLVDEFTQSAADFDSACSDPTVGYTSQVDRRNKSAWLTFGRTTDRKKTPAASVEDDLNFYILDTVLPVTKPRIINGHTWSVASVVDDGNFVPVFDTTNIQAEAYWLFAATSYAGRTWQFEAAVLRNHNLLYQTEVQEAGQMLSSIRFLGVPASPPAAAPGSNTALDLSDNASKETGNFKAASPFPIYWSTSYEDKSQGSGLLAVELYSADGTYQDLVVNTTEPQSDHTLEHADCSGGCYLKISADNMKYHITVLKH